MVNQGKGGSFASEQVGLRGYYRYGLRWLWQGSCDRDSFSIMPRIGSWILAGPVASGSCERVTVTTSGFLRLRLYDSIFGNNNYESILSLDSEQAKA